MTKHESTIKMTRVIFDTNGYREFAEMLKGKSEEEKKDFKERLLKKEKENAFSHVINPLVILELLQHLADKEDPAYRVCKDAILFLGDYPLKGALTPLFDDYLSRMLFGRIKEDSIEVQRMNEIPFVLETIKQNNGSDTIIEELKPQLLDLKNLLIDYKKMLCDALLQSSNGWQTARKGFKLLIGNKKKFNSSVAESIVNRTSEYLGIHITEEEKQERINALIIYFEFAFEMLRVLNEKFLNGNFELTKKGHTNNVIDMIVTFYVNKVNNYVFVTGEKAILKAAEKVGMRDKVISLEEYFKRIDFNA